MSTPSTSQPTLTAESRSAAPLGDVGFAAALLAFVIFCVAWAGFLVLISVDHLDTSSGLTNAAAQLALLLVSGASAVFIYRRLAPIGRSVLIVITIFLFALMGLTAVLGAVADEALNEAFVGPLLWSIRALAVLGCPCVLIVTFVGILGRTSPAETGPETENGLETETGLETEAALLANRRRGLTAAIALLASALIVVTVWSLNQFAPYWTQNWWLGDVLTAVAAALGAIAAIFALRSFAIARSLPRPAPVVGPELRVGRPRSAQTLAFFVIAGGLGFGLTSAMNAAGMDSILAGGYFAWAGGAIGLVIIGPLLAIITLGEVTATRPA